MSPEGYRLLLLEAFRRLQAGDDEMLNLCAMALHESDVAKQRLHDAGFGCTGVGILDSTMAALDTIGTAFGGRDLSAFVNFPCHYGPIVETEPTSAPPPSGSRREAR